MEKQLLWKTNSRPKISWQYRLDYFIVLMNMFVPLSIDLYPGPAGLKDFGSGTALTNMTLSIFMFMPSEYCSGGPSVTNTAAGR